MKNPTDIQQTRQALMVLGIVQALQRGHYTESRQIADAYASRFADERQIISPTYARHVIDLAFDWVPLRRQKLFSRN